jgi:autotransporter-associated beta strand protein
MRRKNKAAVKVCPKVATVALLAVASRASAATIAGTGWKGITDGSWGTVTNWDSTPPSSDERNLFFGDAWSDPTKGNRAGATTANNNISWSGYRINFQPAHTGGGADQTFTLTGNGFTLFDFGGSEPEINNTSSVNQQINNNFTFKPGTATGSVNATNGNITFGTSATNGKMTLDKSNNASFQLNLTGGSGKVITFNGLVINGGARMAVSGSEDVVYNGGITGSGDFLKQGSGTASFNTTATSFGGGTNNIFVDQGIVSAGISGGFGSTDGATTGFIDLGSSNTNALNSTVNIGASGVTIANPILTRYLKTGAKAISGSFSSGSSTYTGQITLNDHVSLNSAGGGTLVFSNVIAQGAGTLSGTPGTGNIVNTNPETGNSFSTNGPGVLINSNGTGTVEFDNTNTYNGDTVVEAGTLQFNGGSLSNSTIRLGNNTGSAAATVNIANAGTVATAINVRPGANGTKTISATNSASTTATYSGHLALDDNGTFTSTNAGATLAITQTQGVDNTTGFDLKGFTATFSGSGDFNVSGTVYNSTNAGTVAMNGTGTLTLSGTNGYSHETDINSGTVAAASNSALGSGTAFVGNGTTTGTAAALSISTSAGGTIVSNVISINPGNGSNRTIGGANTSGTNTFSGLIKMDGSPGENRSLQISESSGGTLALTNTISGAGQNLTVVGPGTVVLSGTNTYSGSTSLNGGTTVFSALSNLGTGTAINFGGGTLQYASGNSADLSARTVTLNSGGGTIDTNGNNVSYANGISGTGGLTKAGAGTLTLNAASTYSGNTNINGGTLLANSTDVTNGSTGSTGIVIVNNGAILGGSGKIIGSVNINTGGTISAGSSTSIGMLTTGAQTWASGASFNVKLGGGNPNGVGSAVAGTDWDLVFSTASITLNASGTYTINISNDGFSGFDHSKPYTWKIAQATANNSISNFNAANFTLNQTGFTLSSGDFFFLTESNNNSELDLNYAPEPSSLMLVGVSIASLGMRRRRRR